MVFLLVFFLLTFMVLSSVEFRIVRRFENITRWKLKREFLVCGLHQLVQVDMDRNMIQATLEKKEYLAMIFEIYRTEDGKASVGQFLEEVEKTGIRKSDPRMANMMKMLHTLRPYTLSSVEDLKLDLGTFKTVIAENVVLITKALQNQLVIPAFETFCDNITEIYNECLGLTSGTAANYIPQLGRYDHTQFGVSICTVDGQRFSLGDAATPFTVQSTCTPLTYAVCLNELGEKKVHEYQGRQPSGRMYNEIVLDYNNKPHNPLVNSGAIMSTALILSLVRDDLKDMATKYEFVHDQIEDMAGGEHLGFNNSVFLAERNSADRNFALAYFMRENNCFPEGIDIKKALDFHFQLCSLEMTCESQSVVASTLANGGICPITGKRIVGSEAVQNVRSLMYSCGMYNYSGQFAFDVGLPAKSGGSGAMMVVVPNVMGISLWSPPLDVFGNTVRGIRFCQELIKRYNFHRFDGVGPTDNKVDPTFKKFESASQAVIHILMAAANGDTLALQRSWLQDIDLSVSDYDGRTALHLAAAEGHLESVKFLLEKCRVHPDPRDRWDRSPLSEAVLFEHARVASYLKDYLENYVEEEKEDDEEDSDIEEEDEDEKEDATEATNVTDPSGTSTISISHPAVESPKSRPRTSSEPRTVVSHANVYLATTEEEVLNPMLFRHRVNTRSPKMSPQESPTLPRAQFEPVEASQKVDNS